MTRQDTALQNRAQNGAASLDWDDDEDTVVAIETTAPKAKAKTAPKPVSDPLAHLGGPAVLDMVSTMVMVADTDLIVRYANPVCTKTFASVEHELRKHFPNFSAENMIGQCVDDFHANPKHQRRMLEEMGDTHDAKIKVGDVSLALRINRIKSDGMTTVGYFLELWDTSFKEKTREQSQILSNDLTALTQSQISGDYRAKLNVDALEGDYKDIAAQVNDMLRTIHRRYNAIGDWMQAVLAGDTSLPVPELPALMAETTRTLQEIQKGVHESRSARGEFRAELERMLSAIREMVEAHNLGEIDHRINPDDFNESFAEITTGINSMVESHINTKKRILLAVTEFAAGDFSTPFPRLPGQRAFISSAIEQLRDAFKGSKDEVSRVSRAMADGDLAIELDSTKFNGEFKTIETSFQLLKNALNEAFTAIAGQVSQASVAVAQLSQSSRDLAQNSQVQSASVDEVSASAEETDVQVKANAAAAEQANQLVTGSATIANQGKEKIAEMVQAMESIRISSQDIAKIIKVIDEIAFQTNLLALNAAVEAARAGQHGRGFAVVAQEVRNLAGRSAKAARETSDLIESAGTRVKAGVKIADEASRAFSSIADDIEKVRRFMHEIATASHEQTKGVAQINLSMGEVAKTALATSQQAEEVASSATEILKATERMRTELSRFQLSQETGKMKTSDALSMLSKLPPNVQSRVNSMLAERDGQGSSQTKSTARSTDRDERGFGQF